MMLNFSVPCLYKYDSNIWEEFKFGEDVLLRPIKTNNAPKIYAYAVLPASLFSINFTALELELCIHSSAPIVNIHLANSTTGKFIILSKKIPSNSELWFKLSISNNTNFKFDSIMVGAKQICGFDRLFGVRNICIDIPEDSHNFVENNFLIAHSMISKNRRELDSNNNHLLLSANISDKPKNWFVTGGASGLGRSLVLELLKLGYTVATTSRNLSNLDFLPQSVIKIQLDVCDITSCKTAISKAVAVMGSIDVLVNNAGVNHVSNFEETPEHVSNSIMETNYWGVHNMCMCIIPHMRTCRRNGIVINVSSASGFRPRNYGSYYVASKFAVENLTKSLKFECNRFMRFISVELGGMNTGLSKRQIVIRSTIPEYKNLPTIFPYEKSHRNSIEKIVKRIIDIPSYIELPRDLILGWDAYNQFIQMINEFKIEVEKYKSISISTDETKLNEIKVEDLILEKLPNNLNSHWLITGASGGFGKVLALRLYKLGYKVSITTRDVSKLNSFPSKIVKIQSNLSSPDECARVIDFARNSNGEINVLVNNATTNCWCRFEECPYDIMRNVFFVNFNIPAMMTKALLPYFRLNHYGTVVNLTSIAGIQPRSLVSTYSAAKAGLEGLTRVLKHECQRFARFMAVELVYMKTNIMKNNPVIKTKIEDYEQLGLYSPNIHNIPNRKDVAAQQIINVVNQNFLPQSLLIGTESYMIAKDEISRLEDEFKRFKDISLSVCEKIK